MPGPAGPTNPIVSQALHSFTQAPTLVELKAKAFELQQLYGSGVAAEFMNWGVRLSPAVTPEERAVGGKSDQQAQQESASAQAAGVDALTESENAADIEAARRAKRIDPKLAPNARVLGEAQRQTGLAYNKDRPLLDEARRVAAARINVGLPSPGTDGGEPAPARGAPAPKQASMLGGGSGAPRQGKTEVSEPEAQDSVPEDAEESLREKAKRLINKLRGLEGDDALSDEDQEKVNQGRREHFRQPGGKPREDVYL